MSSHYFCFLNKGDVVRDSPSWSRSFHEWHALAKNSLVNAVCDGLKKKIHKIIETWSRKPLIITTNHASLSYDIEFLSDHHKEIRKLTFWVLAFCQSESLRQSAHAQNISFRTSLQWPIHQCYCKLCKKDLTTISGIMVLDESYK